MRSSLAEFTGSARGDTSGFDRSIVKCWRPVCACAQRGVPGLRENFASMRRTCTNMSKTSSGATTNQGKCPPMTATAIEPSPRKNAHIRSTEGPLLAPPLRDLSPATPGEAVLRGCPADVGFIVHPLQVEAILRLLQGALETSQDIFRSLDPNLCAKRQRNCGICR